jgi:hypothetical protein
VTEVDVVDRALQLARAELRAPDATLERVWARLPAGAPSVAGSTEQGASALPSGAPKARGWTALKATGTSGALVAAALVGGGFALGFWARGEVNDAARSSVSEAATPAALPTTVLPPAELPPAELPPAVAPPLPPAPAVSSGEAESVSRTPAPSVRAPKARATRASERGSDAQQELALLTRVERALRSDDAALALALLAELERRFPRTELAEERTAARLMAHCMQKRDGADTSANTFLKQHPASVYRSRLRAVCALGTAGEGGQENGSADHGGAGAGH